MVLAGVLYFMNTVLDNMDGKQARRTGSGSPMGMLFDHGSDAFTALMIAILLGRYFQIGNGIGNLVATILPAVPFFFCNLAEYYTGTLDLPALVGPEDTQLAVSVGCWLVAYTGTSIFDNVTYDFGMGEMHITHSLLTLIILAEFVGIFGHVYSSINDAKNTEHFKKRFNFDQFLTQIMILPLMIVVWTSYQFVPGTKSRDEYNMLVVACFGA